ncbi:photosynthetic complex putative assembly protein PuhB [Jannaschia seohaensis]|uniref:PH (Pleckstrin Homology) domain-containing protein n=1 Tax=Jannaschia seohaensis TaxID=475081 RepID=A0A2Y9A5X0_9RHOB|nr:photosynthetic complex putative assembly protein PuhB [Jannaschia seohaensis]PWJ21701.1 PH (Pleckstrin Homology) domain-containing protein [Jannaschia seohaensis]SSA37979.1 PH domain-containing protein [Jannaschia seohaensis]
MDHDDFDQEPIRGLPQMLPDGERILWQGAPSAWALARDALRLRWVAGYFMLFFGWNTVSMAAEMSWGRAAAESSFFLVLGLACCALLGAIAWAQARSTVYTVTDRRVIMRIGAALTLTMQFPYKWVGAADLVTRADGTGTIALRTLGETRFSYLMLWPHARPWRFARTQPALRCIPEAARVARLIAEAAGAAATLPVIAEEPALKGAVPMPAE